ncbi:hypothetical protein AB7M17_006139 [Bradyrhizobium sp. USDA 377]
MTQDPISHSERLASVAVLMPKAVDLLNLLKKLSEEHGASDELLEPAGAKLREAFRAIESKDAITADRSLNEAEQLLSQLLARMPRQ